MLLIDPISCKNMTSNPWLDGCRLQEIYCSKDPIHYFCGLLIYCSINFNWILNNWQKRNSQKKEKREKQIDQYDPHEGSKSNSLIKIYLKYLILNSTKSLFNFSHKEIKSGKNWLRLCAFLAYHLYAFLFSESLIVISSFIHLRVPIVKNNYSVGIQFLTIVEIIFLHYFSCLVSKCF